MSAWFDDDTFWESLEGFLFSQFRSFEIAGREAEQILALVHLPPRAAGLDLCCGPGRNALEFARRGFQVTGVDRTGFIGKAHFSSRATFRPTGTPECRRSGACYGPDWHGPYMGFQYVAQGSA